MSKAISCAAAVFLASLGSAEAQQPPPVRTINLAGVSDVTEDVVPDSVFRIRVINVAPGRRYSYEIRRVVHPVDPLELIGVQKATGPCEALKDAVGELQAPDLAEEAVAAAVTKVENAIPACNDQDLRDLAKQALARTEVDLGVTSVARGEKVVVTIRRDKRSWIATFDGGKRGEWQGSYGFIYSPPGDELYFTKAAGEGKFQITPQQDRGGYKFTPMAFYSWLPASRANSDFALGVTGGLGFQNDRPSVAFGVAAIFNRNLSLVGGVLVRSVLRLNGQYDVNALPEVGENLTEAQLHTNTYRPTGFVGITFRFNENPFSNGGDGDKPKDAPTGGGK
jgi:hypothetical protein